MEMVIIGTKQVRGHKVIWTNDSIVRPTRELCDLLPEDMELPLRANTVGDFYKVVARLTESCNT